MSNDESIRQRGGVSQHLRFIQASLRLPGDDQSPNKPGALIELRKLVEIVLDQTRAGDPECGYFVGELAAYLSKGRETLERANANFSKVVNRLGSAHPKTKRSSPLRPIIHQIITEAIREKFVQGVIANIPHAEEAFPRNALLLELPEFHNDPDAISAWTEKLVYPALRQRESELEQDPVIGQFKKARDENGKFHVSRLKPLIRQTVARIARVPKTYYFRIA